MITGLFSWLCAYPALYAIVGTTLPSLAGRFLEGASGTVRSYKAAGLPNITGNLRVATEKTDEVSDNTYGAFSTSEYGAVKQIYWGGSNSATHKDITFSATKSSSIYGNSTTVQPKSYTVNYLIKAY